MDIIERIASGKELSVKEWIQAIDCDDPGYAEELKAAVSYTRDRIYGKKVFARGLIEFTSYCRNDCYYCGLRRSNKRRGTGQDSVHSSFRAERTAILPMSGLS